MILLVLAFICEKKKTKHYLINIGTGRDHSINFYAKEIQKILIPEKKIKIKYDLSKPNGTPRKVLDVSLAKDMAGNLKSILMKL